MVLVENKKREIAKFYRQILSDPKLKERIEEKVKKIANEEDFKNLIQQEIVPLMKKYDVNFSEEELLEYEKETLKKLSKEDIANVSGGASIKPMLGTSLLALTLMGVAATGQISNAMINGDDDDNGGKPQSSWFGGLLSTVKSFLPGSQQLEAIHSRFEAAKNELPEGLIKHIEENDILSKIFVIDDNGNLFEKVEIDGSDEFAIDLWCKEGQTECQIPDEVTDYNGVRHTVDKICSIDSVEKITISPKVKNIKIGHGGTSDLEIVDFSDANPFANITLGSFAFSYAEKLKTVILPKKSGNITIGENAFWKCKSLEKVNINAKTVKIGNDSFGDCENLREANITGEKVEVGEEAFSGTKVTKLNVKAKNFICADNTGILVNKESFESAAKKLPENILNSPYFDLNSCLIDKNGNLYKFYPQENSDKVQIDLLAGEGQTEFQIPEKAWDVYGKEFTVGSVSCGRYGSMENIQKITVDPALKELEIDDYCFYNCPNLGIVNFSGLGKLTIGSYAVGNCKSLEKVNINAKTVKIGNDSFGDCENLREANITGEKVEVGEMAFLRTAIKELTISADNVTCADNIGVPWRGKDGTLHEIVYKNAPVPTSINMDSYDLNEQILPTGEPPLNIDYDSNEDTDNYNNYSENDDDEEQLEEEAPRVNQERFDNAARELPETITNSPDFYLESCVMDKNGNVYGWLEIEGSDKVDISLIAKTGQKEWQIPKKVFDIDGNEYIVGEIHSDEYGSMKNLEKLTAEQDVENINIHSFPKESNLKIIDFSATHLRECIINNVAFYNCHNLVSLLLPEIGVEKMTLEYAAFSDCEKLSKVNINAKNVIVGENAFEDCTGLKEANISGKNVSVGESAFRNGANLKKANISGERVDIEKRAFDGCKNLKTLATNGKEISIKEWAFDDCDNLETVNFSEDCNSVKIGEYAFSSKKLVLKIFAENVTCAEDIGVPWYDKDNNRHPELSVDDSEEENRESYFSNNFDDDDDDDGINNSHSYSMPGLSDQFSALIKPIIDNLNEELRSAKTNEEKKACEEKLKDYTKAIKQGEIGTDGSNIYFFTRNENNPMECTIIYMFTDPTLNYIYFPPTIMADNQITQRVTYNEKGKEKLEDVSTKESIKVGSINLKNTNLPLATKNSAEEFNRKIRVANINYVACNKPNRFGFGGDALDVAAENLISVLKQIKSLDELNEPSRKNVIIDIEYLHRYVKLNGNEFFLEGALVRYTGANNLELVEQFYETCKNEQI